MNIGAKIKEIRIKLGLTQEEFANTINKSKHSVKKYEDNSGITIDLLQDISNKCDVSMLALFTDCTDLFELFVTINNLELTEEEKTKLEIEFNSYMEFLLYKYK